MKPKIKNLLRFYRKQKGITQLQVANHLGFKSIDRISKWENGLTFPHPKNLFKMAKLYKVFPHEIYEDLWYGC